MPQTFLDRPPFVYAWKPLYRKVLVPHIYPLFAGVMNRFLRIQIDTTTQLLQPELALLRSDLEHLRSQLLLLRTEIAGIQLTQGQLESAQTSSASTVMARINEIYEDSLGQWSAMEHTLVTALRVSGHYAERHSESLERMSRQQTAMLTQIRDLTALGEMQRQVKAKIARDATDRKKFWEGVENLLASALSQPRIEVTQSTGCNTLNRHG